VVPDSRNLLKFARNSGKPVQGFCHESLSVNNQKRHMAVRRRELDQRSQAATLEDRPAGASVGGTLVVDRGEIVEGVHPGQGIRATNRPEAGTK
jgi:hypothetical protein